MPVVMRILLAVVLVPVLLFCVFGLLATFEPLDRTVQLTWRALYVVAGAGCLGAIVWLLMPPRRGGDG